LAEFIRASRVTEFDFTEVSAFWWVDEMLACSQGRMFPELRVGNLEIFMFLLVRNDERRAISRNRIP
jgi:hypothetical protein